MTDLFCPFYLFPLIFEIPLSNLFCCLSHIWIYNAFMCPSYVWKPKTTGNDTELCAIDPFLDIKQLFWNKKKVVLKIKQEYNRVRQYSICNLWCVIPLACLELECVSVWCHIIFLFVFVILFTGSIPQPENWQRRDMTRMIRLPLRRSSCVASVMRFWLDDCPPVSPLLSSPAPSSRHVYWRNIHWVVSRGDPLSATPGV